MNGYSKIRIPAALAVGVVKTAEYLAKQSNEKLGKFIVYVTALSFSLSLLNIDVSRRRRRNF